MPRIARQYQTEKSYIFHILNRGILCQPIFHDDQDTSYFLKVIKRYQQKIPFLAYHWCIMSNHYHLVAELSKPSLISKIVGACQQIYALYYHRKYHTAGKLFQNRFKSQAIEKESYLFSCGRYVELNPVRARLVEFAWDWKWSSARFYTAGQNDDITSPDPEWKGKSAQEYKKWLSDSNTAQKEQGIFSSSRTIIGSDNFRDKFAVQQGCPKPKKRGGPWEKKRESKG